MSMGIVMTFTPLHVLGYNYQPRRIVETTDSYNCWSYLSSMGSGITVLSMIILTCIGVKSQEVQGLRAGVSMPDGIIDKWR